ncbi:MAG: hypothetical protein ABH832_03700 [bacterium]
MKAQGRHANFKATLIAGLRALELVHELKRHKKIIVVGEDGQEQILRIVVL